MVYYGIPIFRLVFFFQRVYLYWPPVLNLITRSCSSLSLSWPCCLLIRTGNLQFGSVWADGKRRKYKSKRSSQQHSWMSLDLSLKAFQHSVKSVDYWPFGWNSKVSRQGWPIEFVTRTVCVNFLWSVLIKNSSQSHNSRNRSFKLCVPIDRPNSTCCFLMRLLWSGHPEPPALCLSFSVFTLSAHFSCF